MENIHIQAFPDFQQGLFHPLSLLAKLLLFYYFRAFLVKGEAQCPTYNVTMGALYTTKVTPMLLFQSYLYVSKLRPLFTFSKLPIGSSHVLCYILLCAGGLCCVLVCCLVFWCIVV